MDELGALLDEMEQTRSGIVKTEIQLANLHADIYKCREETRRVRLSLPTTDSLEEVRKKLPDMTEEETTRMFRKLTRKRRQVEASLAAMRKRTHCDIQRTCPRPPMNRHGNAPMFSYVLFTTLLLGVSFFIGKSWTHRR